VYFGSLITGKSDEYKKLNNNVKYKRRSSITEEVSKSNGLTSKNTTIKNIVNQSTAFQEQTHLFSIIISH
jgi:hypothetical protein